MQQHAAKVIVFFANHFDLVWRRCWKRSYVYQGLTYRSYSDLEEAIISRSLALAEQQSASFMLEQAYSLREYLARHPAALPRFQALARAGRFKLQGGGEVLIDINMCNGETMARNYASGVRYVRALFGELPETLCHQDGFGSSAQFPQIARLCGTRGILGLTYLQPDAPFWRGLDGSTVFTGFPLSGKWFFFDHCYYEPCLQCGGERTVAGVPCVQCEGTGLRLSQGVYPPPEWVSELDAPLGQYVPASEELMPDAALPALVAQRNAEGGPISYEWGTYSTLMPLWQADLNRIDATGIPISSRVENNPVFSGTLVSRIRQKQRARLAEETFYTGEALAALLTRGQQAEIRERSDDLWRDLPFIFFHDAITGTHIDPAHEELLDCADQLITRAHSLAAEAVSLHWPTAQQVHGWGGAGQITVFNPLGVSASLPVELPADGEGYAVTDQHVISMPVYREPGQQCPPAGELAPVGPGYWTKRDLAPPTSLRFLATDVPPFGMKTFQLRPCAPAPDVPLTEMAEWNGYRLRWNETGVYSLVDLASGHDLLPEHAAPLGHLILEEDFGSPWGTRSLQRARTSCASMSRLLGAVQRRDAVELTFAGKLKNGIFGQEVDANVFGLEWYQTVRLPAGLPWVEIECEIFWQTVDRRIRLAFPSRSKTDRGLYHIPFGVLERERYEMTEANFSSPNGDWAACYFAATLPDGEIPGIAVLNTGTPSVRIEDGTLLYSVLRSPGFGHCLNRYAQEYPMPVSGMRDSGHHHFRFALLPYTGGNLAEILHAAYLLNRPAAAFSGAKEMAEWQSGLSTDDAGAVLATVKCAYDGEGIAVRVVEHLGSERVANISLPEWVTSAARTNLLEEAAEALPIDAGRVKMHLRPFEIATLLLR